MDDALDTPATPPPQPKPSGSRGTRILVGLTAVALLAFAGSVGVVWYLVNKVDHGEVREESFLSLKLRGSLTESPQQGGLVIDPALAPPIVTEVSESIRQAADDDRIEGLFLEIDTPALGWSGYQEIRDAVLAFREAGKPCIAHALTGFSNGSYYLASACDTVSMSPATAMFVTGLAYELSYYRGTFDKLGVEPEYEHVGDFKSFIESYERTGPSQPAAEAFEYLLDGLYSQLVAGIAEGRGVSPDVVADWIDNPTLTPNGALDRGMIDYVAHADDMAASVEVYGDDGWADSLGETIASDDDLEGLFTPFGEYLKSVRAAGRGPGDRIAVIHAEGGIVSGDESSGLFADEALTDGEFAAWMSAARDDEDVRAVVVRVASRGGSALASMNMWREVARTQADGKPVVVSMADYAASGGYLMSAGADWIFAQPGTITGSIGVFGGKFDTSGFWEKLGISGHTFKRGDEADLFSLNAPFSDKGRAAFKGYLAEFYDEFIDTVAEGRSLEWDAVHAVAQGRVWTGEQALERKLVDELGGLEEALAKAAELAELGDWKVRRIPEQKGFFDLLLEDMAEPQASVPVVLGQMGLDPGLAADAMLMLEVSASEPLMAFSPGRVRVD